MTLSLWSCSLDKADLLGWSEYHASFLGFNQFLSRPWVLSNSIRGTDELTYLIVYDCMARRLALVARWQFALNILNVRACEECQYLDIGQSPFYEPHAPDVHFRGLEA